LARDSQDSSPLRDVIGSHLERVFQQGEFVSVESFK
jgi:hypothetical protein